MRARLASAGKRLGEIEAETADRQAIALIDGREHDSTADLANLAAHRADVSALSRAVEMLAESHANAVAADKRDRISAATEAWDQAVQARNADIARSMAAMAAVLERLQAQGVRPADLTHWTTVHAPAFLHHSITSDAMPDGIGRLERAHAELTDAMGQGAGRGITDALQTALPVPDRAAIDEMAEAMLPVVVVGE
jgi:hypothetical protein